MESFGDKHVPRGRYQKSGIFIFVCHHVATHHRSQQAIPTQKVACAHAHTQNGMSMRVYMYVACLRPKSGWQDACICRLSVSCKLLGLGYLFVFKWIHIKHYGPILGELFFWLDSTSFSEPTGQAWPHLPTRSSIARHSKANARPGQVWPDRERSTIRYYIFAKINEVVIFL